MDKVGIVFLFAVVIAAVVALGGYVTMLWLGLINGYFGLLAPLGYVESTITLVATSLVAGFLFPTNVKS